jgi:hypothetical protein
MAIFGVLCRLKLVEYGHHDDDSVLGLKLFFRLDGPIGGRGQVGCRFKVVCQG